MRKPVLSAAVLLSVSALALTACASGSSKDASPAASSASATAQGGGATENPAAVVNADQPQKVNLSPDQNRYTAPEDPKIAAEVPAAIRKRGTLQVVDAAASGGAPLAFFANDNKTQIGVEIDLASAVSDVLGLKPQYNAVDWAQIFVGLDSGKYDVGFSNITDTELRKQKYDFASYRDDNIGFLARKDENWTVKGPADVAGKTIAVDSGTNQEKILLDWSKQDVANGLKPVTVKYYSAGNSVYLALTSGRIDAYLEPNPSAQYYATTSGTTKVVGIFSGAGPSLQGLISATTKKGNGLVKPLADALNELIKDGTYGKILARWGLTSEAVPTSQINPPGLPNS